MLFNVRYEIAVSEMMECDIGEGSLEMTIRLEFAKLDPDDDGYLTIQQCDTALKHCKKLNLTPFQIHVLLGMSDCDGDGVVAYKEFSKIIEEFINENFKFEDMVKKKDLYEANKHNFAKNHP